MRDSFFGKLSCKNNYIKKHLLKVIFMGKLAQATSKYTIFAKFDADGTVEKPDVIGAVFGQTEGLLGQELDLRELQRTGRIGRIDVEMASRNGKVSGVITIPSSLDGSETALIAACCETIERVGPCNASVIVEKIEDVRASKRKYVIDRAKELLEKILDIGMEAQEISEQIKEAVRSSEITTYEGLPAGPNIANSDSIVIVEGRADVMNLLRSGIKNAIAIEGTSVPEAVAKLTKEKMTTVFLDGDRGGDLILKEILAVGEIDFVSRAPRGKEVEELTKKEIFKALREQAPIDQYKQEFMGANGSEKIRQPAEQRSLIDVPDQKKMPKKIDGEIIDKLKGVLNELTGTRAAYFMDDGMNILGKVPVKEMFNVMKELRPDTLVFDGEVDQKLITFSGQRGVRYIAGMRLRGRIQVPDDMQVFTVENLA